jgi:dihydrofolate synthase / folylpolyglutamate synthase
MNYEQTLEFLFKSLPMYQRVGAMAFKKDLTNTLKLCEALGNPQNKFKSVHIAGTNGKGSSSHSIAAVLQSAGYKTGLYTSPHLKSFTERIRINGNEIDRAAVVQFVEDNKVVIERIKPSFFEMTVAMAFDYFAKQKVDIAIIETGLGGRLDSTNVITPELSLITNISLDHTDMLGNTLEAISIEKAGIIKHSTPVVIGTSQKETSDVFLKTAADNESAITFADQCDINTSNINLDLKGEAHLKNIPGIIESLEILKKKGFVFSDEELLHGLANVQELTGLKGRWQTINNSPLTICDTGHNVDAFKYIINQIASLNFNQLKLVLGFVDDKNITDLLKMLPKNAIVCFCVANVPRAMSFDKLKPIAQAFFPDAIYIKDVNSAIRITQENANDDDFVFVGGSTFVVAEIENL